MKDDVVERETKPKGPMAGKIKMAIKFCISPAADGIYSHRDHEIYHRWRRTVTTGVKSSTKKEVTKRGTRGRGLNTVGTPTTSRIFAIIRLFSRCSRHCHALFIVARRIVSPSVHFDPLRAAQPSKLRRDSWFKLSLLVIDQPVSIVRDPNRHGEQWELRSGKPFGALGAIVSCLMEYLPVTGTKTIARIEFLVRSVLFSATLVRRSVDRHWS